MSKTKKECIIVIVVLLLCAVIALWVAPAMYRMYTEHREKMHAEELKEAKVEYPFLDNIVIKRYQGKDYYVAKKSYKGEYDHQSLSYYWTSNEALEEPIPGKVGEFKAEWHHMAMDGIDVKNEVREVNERPLEEAAVLQVMSYEEYVDYCEKWRLDQKYTDPDLKYIVRGRYTETYFDWVSLSDVRYEDTTAVLYFVEESSSMLENGVKIYIIPTEQDVDTVEVVQVYSEEEYENILEFGQTSNPYVID